MTPKPQEGAVRSAVAPKLRGDGNITKLLLGLFLAGGLLRLALVVLTPPYPDEGIIPGYNDEPLHLQYVIHIASGEGWPIWQPSSGDPRDLTDEYVQPPLYYALASSIYHLAEIIRSGWGMYGARLLSLFFGLVAGLFVYRTALLWAGGVRIAAGALAALMLAPNAVVFTTLVTNDSLLVCLSAMVIYSILVCRSGRGGVARRVLTGMFLAAAVWTKMSGLLLFPLAWFAGSVDMPRTERWLARGTVLAVAMAMVMPLFAWNLAHYGRVVPLASGYSPEEVIGVAGGAVYHPLAAVKYWLRSAAMPFDTVWGSILEKAVSIVWVMLWGGLTFIGGYLLIGRRSIGGIFIAAILMVAAGFIWHNIELFQVEFRLFAPAFPAMAVAAAWGARAIRLSPFSQAVLWVLPLILLPLY